MFNPLKVRAAQIRTSLFKLTLTGEDVFSFLQNQSTFNISEIASGHFQLISFLDPHGKVLFYGFLENLTNFNLFVPPVLKEVAIERLNKFLISEDVEILEAGECPVYFALGDKILGQGSRGVLFEENSILSTSPFSYPELSNEEVCFWRDMNGWPSLNGEHFESQLLNNTRLFELALSERKGCYPGQETVAKIATRRGAAYSPVLIKLDRAPSVGNIQSFDKRIGKIHSVHEWNGSFYANAEILRDFRVKGLKFEFQDAHSEYSGEILYYPFFNPSPRNKAEEFHFEAIEHFKKDELREAEKAFVSAIEIDPTYSDAFESLGVMLGREEKFTQAIEWMDKLLEVDPRSVMAHTNKSLYLMRLGKIDEAEQEKSLATVKSFQKFGDEAKLKKQIEEQNQKELEEWKRREDMFLQVLEIDAEDTLANFGLGSIEVERNNYEKAIEYLEKVISADENYSVAYLALGKALKGSGEIDRAKTIWKKGIEVAAKKGDLMPANQMQAELNGF